MSTAEQNTRNWSKPELVKLGELKDVAGPNAINSDGKSGNTKDPAPS